MNEIQRSVLQRQSRKIAEGIIMNEDILSALYQRKIFQTNMMELIRAETTATNRVYKMLELLTKRGPLAFDAFIEVIQVDYPWIAVSLLSEVEQYTARSINHTDGTDGPKSEKKTENEFSDIRKKVNTFVHKHFGQSKKLAEKEKKLMATWMTNQLTNERIRLESLTCSDLGDTSECDFVDNERTQANIKEELYEMYRKLEPFVSKIATDGSNSVSLQIHCLDDMSFALLHEQLDRVCFLFTRLQQEMDESLVQFESCVRQNGLPVLVESLMLKSNHQYESLDKIDKRNADLMNRVGDLSEEVYNLETERAHMRCQIERMHTDLSNHRHDKFKAHDKIKDLEKTNFEYAEQIDNLKSDIKELQKHQTAKRGECFKSPVRKSSQASPTRAVNYNTTLFSRRSGQFYSGFLKNKTSTSQLNKLK